MGQGRAIKLIAQRFEPEIFHMAAFIECGARHHIHKAEAARIIVNNARPALHVEDHMVMRCEVTGLMDKFALLGAQAAFNNGEATGHAQMHDQRLAR